MNNSGYLRASKDYFWRWEDDGKVASIVGGNTIAYSDYLLELVELLRPQGIPPFGALLLVLIATNPDAENDLKKVRAELSSRYPQFSMTDECKVGFRFLHLLTQMPRIYQSGTNRILLIQTVFQNAHNLLSSYSTVPMRLMEEQPFHEGIMNRDFSVLRVQGNRIDSVRALEALMQGLPSVPEEKLELERTLIPEDTRPTSYLDELLEDARSFPAAALVRSVWSGLDIPFQQSISSDQPMGGVSDLTNKGQFDKLLTSEFANDDLTFLSRLANSEALYLNREVPPVHNQYERVLLIDASLKAWGRPKIIAHAVAIAIAKHPKSPFAYSCHALGAGFKTIFIETVEEVIEGLSVLEATIDASSGLEAFFAAHPPTAQQQVIYIGAEEAMQSASFQKVFSEHRANIQFLISTHADGTVRLHKNTGKSLRHVNDFKLDLDELWTRKPPKEKPQHRTRELDAVQILLPRPPKSRDTLYAENGVVFKITNNGHILRSYYNFKEGNKAGWEEIGVGINPPKGQYEIGRNYQGEWILLVYVEESKEVRLINLVSSEVQYVPFPSFKMATTWAARWPQKGFIFHNGVFHHQNHTGKWTIDVNGKVSEEERLTSLDVEGKLALVRKGVTDNSSQSVLKNVEHVYINRELCLSFDKHVLQIDKQENIRLNTNTTAINRIDSERIGEHTFVFPDGSTVHTSKKGYIKLVSASAELPAIYLPAVLKKPLGLAAGTEFAGNKFYLKEKLYEVHLVERGGRVLDVIKVIVSELGWELKEAKGVAYDGALVTVLPWSKATGLQGKLEAQGATVRLEEEQNHPGADNYATVRGASFYINYILAFITHIREYGTTD